MTEHEIRSALELERLLQHKTHRARFSAGARLFVRDMAARARAHRGGRRFGSLSHLQSTWLVSLVVEHRAGVRPPELVAESAALLRLRSGA